LSKKIEELSFAKAILALKDNLRYPILTFEDLHNQIGEAITIENEKVRLDYLKEMARLHFVCQSYLPITDTKDFVNKAHKFYDIVYMDDIWQENRKNIAHNTQV
jgi:hypothetical protein